MLFAAVEELLCGIEKQVDSSLLETPQDRHMADVALPCFRLAKERGQAPHEIAASIATQLTPNKKIAKIEATGPYVNFFAHPGRLAGEILPHIAEKKERYGYAPARNEKILLE